ncbi:MAG: class II glutamine amidotransferase [Deltaproteobacteria bacterium]|nr:class II glutamine amidotransferase [Deltaproteobacteria bacterium]MBW2363292.1 class II glutamine amidotransferase [Deltaproteobacteria bacterium]
MCRWLAYSGKPLALEKFIFEPEHSLIDQSLSATMAPNPTNGDGFGVGWYGKAGDPGRYRAIQPAWNDPNLREIAHHIESPLFLAHVRRSTGTPVQESNCHPFRHGQWLFVHNGLIYGYEKIRRDLLLEIDPKLFSQVAGSADSEVLFYLALTYGLPADPLGALERTVGLVEKLGREAGFDNPMQMTVGVSDGRTLWTIRYSSVGDSRTLFYNTDVSALRELYPDNPRLHGIDDDARVVASEPLGSLSGVWNPVPEATASIIGGGRIEHVPFSPSAA